MNREALFRELLLEFLGETSLPPQAEIERLIRGAIERRLTPRQFLDEFLDSCPTPFPARTP
jgi:hypothetical protein